METNDTITNASEPSGNIFKRVCRFYVSGFKDMSVMSKKLWLIILIKLFIMFAILRLFFFPNFLKQEAGSKADDKSRYVQEQLVQRKVNPAVK